MGASDHAEAELPIYDSPSLTLVHPTPEEIHSIWKLNAVSWAGALSLPDYIERELHLSSQAATIDGGILFWALVDSKEPVEKRRILSAFESFRRTALVNVNGEVKEGICYGIGSVFCPPNHRGRRYATRMMNEYATLLQRVNAGQKDQFVVKSLFSMLYSDIGKVGANL
jgi:hypothetical protein